MKKSAKPMRSEQAIFDELAELCVSPGYVHAIAYLCFRDNMILYSGEMNAKDMHHLFSKSRLIRTETSTLIGLMLKCDIDYTLPAPKTLDHYVKTTEALLEEIHHTMSAAFWEGIDPAKMADKGFNPFTSGAVLREPIFYGGESAYSFQYRDFSLAKYGRDDNWLVANKGFSIQEARNIVYAISRLLDEKTVKTFKSLRKDAPEDWTFLPGTTFASQEVADCARMDVAVVERILNAFAAPAGPCNKHFTALHDFNIVNACPLIPTPDGGYVVFHIYSLVEALYEAPFYWMGADKAYVNTAMEHRGLFTEQFAIERLTQVFGASNVLPNIDIFGSKGNKLGEIDVLVLFGNRALVLQAKSKRLTLEARRGNDLQIQDDFKKSIQDSCDQAYLCAQLLEEGRCTFRDTAGNTVMLPDELKRIYILCLVSDHYPALSFQARQFLKSTPNATMSPPFVMDVFALDAITEMLNSPLQLLSYIDRRTGYTEKLMASHELTILSYHLKQNLWLNDEHDMVLLDDDISADLDLAMLVRRDGIPGNATPDGILTRFAATALGRITKAIEASPEPATIDLGFMLLTLGEDTVIAVSKAIDHIAQQALADGKSHDFTAGLGHGETGLTIHCNNDSLEVAGSSLQRHCHARKYTERAISWFGVCLHPNDQALRFGINLDFPWQQSNEMDVLTKGMGKAASLPTVVSRLGSNGLKVGRNDPCPCGSGKKFKKCCLPKRASIKPQSPQGCK
jgi:hypothetical protein